MCRSMNVLDSEQFSKPIMEGVLNVKTGQPQPACSEFIKLLE